jgi:hypothetical protein
MSGSVARIAIAIVLLHIAGSTFAAPAPAPAGPGDPPGSGRLGKFGDLRTLLIEGAVLIPADALRRTLAKDWALQDAPAMPEPQALLDDLRFTVEGDTALARDVRGSAEVLRAMNDADVQAIARILPPAVATLFERIARQLKHRHDEPVQKVMLDAITQLWTPALRDQLITDLSTIAVGKRP